MVFVLLAVLVGAAYVCPARASYGDYAAAKMPQYGSEEYRESARDLAHIEDDYQDQDRSPEAPASPDYKYEEDNLNVRSASTSNDDEWQKTSKRTPSHRRLGGNLHLKGLTLDNGDKIKPKIKQTLRRHSKWRNSDGSVEINRIPLSGGRIRSNDIIDKDDDTNEETYEPSFNDEKKFRSTSEKIIRRKARDRADASTEADSDDADDDDDDESKGENYNEKEKDGEYPASEDSPSKDQYGLSIDKKDEYATKRPGRADDDIIARLEANKLDQKSQEEYQDYYDMKRVNNIKKKITVLYRRSKARATGSTTSHRVQVWTYRRSYVLDRYNIPTDDSEEIVPTTRRRKNKKKNRTKAQMKVLIDTTPLNQFQWSRVISTTEPEPPVQTQAEPERTTLNIVATTATIAAVRPTTTATTLNSTENTTKELSMAEKSRLSILRKTLLKEGVFNTTTVKPPVLLHMSQQMNTMVVVEQTKPSINKGSLQNLGPLVDSPERIARVKSIMRRKLISSARRIEDLTNNWDETVCDYVDTSLLDSVNKNVPSVSLILFGVYLFYKVF